jgi:hypothetical protein
MMGIPSIRAAVVVWEGRLQTLECRVSGTHDSLPHIVEAVNHMPMVIIRNRMTSLETSICLNNGVLKKKSEVSGYTDLNNSVTPTGQIHTRQWS